MKNLLLFAFILISSVVSAQSVDDQTIHSTDIGEEWSLVLSEQGVNLYAKRIVCSLNGSMDAEKLAWKIENSIDSKILFRFNKQIYFNEVCKNCGSSSTEYLSTFVLDSESSLITSCNVKDSDNMFIKFTNRKNKQELTRLVLTEIQISKL